MHLQLKAFCNQTRELVDFVFKNRMNFNLLLLSCLVSLGSTAWNQPSNSCYARQFSSCGVMEKLDEILVTLKMIAESK